jgi:hypothetical protein
VLLSCSLLAALVTLASAGDAKSALETARVGQWTLGKTVMPSSNYTMFTYVWVSKVDSRKVTLSQQILKDKNTGLVPATTTVIDLDKKPEAPLKESAKPKVSEEEIALENGKKLKCTRTEGETEISGMGKLVTIVWTSPEIPINNMAKSIVKDKDGKTLSTSETLDYGQAGGAEKPLK